MKSREERFVVTFRTKAEAAANVYELNNIEGRTVVHPLEARLIGDDGLPVDLERELIVEAMNR